MLVLSRKVGEELLIGDKISLIVKRVAGNRVLLGIEAPSEVHVIRGELQLFLGEFMANSEAPLKEFVDRCVSTR